MEVHPASVGEERVLEVARRCRWLSTYMEYTLHSEPPAEFHMLVGLTILGLALGRKVQYTHGVFKVYPNIYSLLVAPSGRCRKSTAIKTGIDILHKAGLPEIKIVGPKITPEALIQTLYRERPAREGDRIVKVYPDSVTLVYAPELAVFLNTRDFNKDTVPLLTDLYDAPDVWTTSTISRGEITLRNIFVACISASTIHWLVDLVPKSAFGGGFMGRLLIAALEDTPRIFPVPQPPPQDLLAQLIGDLQTYGEYSATLTLDSLATMWFTEWYKGERHNRRGREDDRWAGYLERKPITVLKLAMIRASADCRRVMQADDLQWGVDVLGLLERGIADVYEAIGSVETRTLETQLIDRLTSYLKMNEYCLLSEIMRYMIATGVSVTKVREMLGTLQEAGLVEVRRSIDKVIYRYKYPLPRGSEDEAD